MIYAPEGFENALKNYDPRLTLRWGETIKQWVIERHAMRMTEGEKRLLRYAATRTNPEPKAVEEWASAQAGKYVIHYVKELDQRVFDYLWARDLQRKGGAKSLYQSVLSFPEVRTRARKRESHELARQTNDVIHWALNRKSTEIQHGKGDELMREGFGMKPVTKNPGPVKPMLVDQFGRPIDPQTKKVKLELASRW